MLLLLLEKKEMFVSQLTGEFAVSRSGLAQSDSQCDYFTSVSFMFDDKSENILGDAVSVWNRQNFFIRLDLYRIDLIKN